MPVIRLVTERPCIKCCLLLAHIVRIASSSWCGLLLQMSSHMVICVHVSVSPVKTAKPIEMPFGRRLVWVQETMYQVGCTLAPPGEYDNMICGSGDAGCRYHYCSNLLLRTLTISGCSKTAKWRSIETEADHSVAFTVEILQRPQNVEIKLADMIVSDVEMCQPLKNTKLQRVGRRKSQLVESQVKALGVFQFAESIRRQTLDAVASQWDHLHVWHLLEMHAAKRKPSLKWFLQNFRLNN